MSLETIISIILGLVIGSFISAFTFRFPKKISFVKGRSFCPNCKKKISWFDNIPLLSFLLLRGKCRYCKEKISLRYPILELSTAMFFVIIFRNFYPDFVQIVTFFIFYFITASVIVIDLEEGIIPDELSFLGFAISFFYVIFFNNQVSFQHILGGFCSSLFFLMINLITKQKGMGLGDVKFALFPGTFLLFPFNVLWIFLSFILGSIVGIIMILFKKAKFGKPIPFGPFLGISFIIIIIWGESLLDFLFLYI